MEEFLCEELLKALKRKPELKITIVLDYGRGLRDGIGKTSLKMLERLHLKVTINFAFIFDLPIFKKYKTRFFC